MHCTLSTLMGKARYKNGCQRRGLVRQWLNSSNVAKIKTLLIWKRTIVRQTLPV